MKNINLPESISLKKPTLDFILCIILVVIFSLSVYLSFMFFNFNYIMGITPNDNQKITLSYDKLIEGNSSSNLAQYRLSETNNRVSYGDFCVKSNSIYFQKNKNKKTYLMKSSKTNPASESPLLEGYDISYINVSNNMVYFIGKKQDSKSASKIYMMGAEGESFQEIETELTKDITSLVTNSNYLYFTVDGSSKVYTSSMDGQKVLPLACSDIGGTDIRIFGVDKNFLYCVTGKACVKIDFSTLTTNKITNDCYSIYQSPVLTSDGILFYSSITSDEYLYISKAGGPTSKVLNKTQLKEVFDGKEIRLVNYSEGYIFLVVEKDIYYSKLGSSELKQLKGINPSENGKVFFDTEYCIVEKEDSLSALNINWLLSS